MKNTFLIALAISLYFIAPVSGQKIDNRYELNGKTFVIQLSKTEGQRKGWQWTTDEITFHLGRLKSKVMTDKEHFRAAPFTIAIDTSGSGKKYLYEALGTNTGGSTVKWKGIVKGESIEGTAVWKNRQGIQSYKFYGILKK